MMDFGDRIYYWRQVLVMMGVYFQGVTVGIVLAFPSVLNSKYNEATGVVISNDQASWLVSTTGLIGVIGLCIISTIFDTYGRKIAHCCICFILLISWIIIYFASSVTWLYIGRIVQGIPFGVIYIYSIIISEYTSPESRGFLSTIMKVTMAIGSLTCHCLSFWTWREPAAAAIVSALLSLFFAIWWPESPSFYAYKGRFEDCSKAFTWLHGPSLKMRKELAELIAAQIEVSKFKARRNYSRPKVFLKAFLERDFQMALFLSFLVTLALDTCGRYFVVAYIVQIMVEVVGKDHAVYYSIAVDCIIITSLSISCFVVKYIKRRTVLFVFGFLNVAIMLTITLVLYLKNKMFFSDVTWLTPALLLLQNFVINVGLIPICYCISGEVFPLEYKGIGTTLSGILFCLCYATVIKATPIMLHDIGLGGTYGTYGACLAATLVAMYFSVPETKNRTLQDIEDEMKGVKTNAEQVLMKLNENAVHELNMKLL